MSAFGTIFRVTTFGESHCKGVGAVVDGCPPNLELSETDIQHRLTGGGRDKASDHRPPGNRYGLHFFRGGKRQNPGHPHRPFRAQPRPAAETTSMSRPETVARRLHLSNEIRHARVQRWRTFQCPGNHRAGGRRGHRRKSTGFGPCVEIVAWVSAVNEVDMPPADMETISRTTVDATWCAVP